MGALGGGIEPAACDRPYRIEAYPLGKGGTGGTDTSPTFSYDPLVLCGPESEPEKSLPALARRCFRSGRAEEDEGVVMDVESRDVVGVPSKLAVEGDSRRAAGMVGPVSSPYSCVPAPNRAESSDTSHLPSGELIICLSPADGVVGTLPDLPTPVAELLDILRSRVGEPDLDPLPDPDTVPKGGGGNLLPLDPLLPFGVLPNPSSLRIASCVSLSISRPSLTSHPDPDLPDTFSLLLRWLSDRTSPLPLLDALFGVGGAFALAFTASIVEIDGVAVEVNVEGK